MSEQLEEKIMIYKVSCYMCNNIKHIISHQGVEPIKEYICADCQVIIHRDRIITRRIRKILPSGDKDGYKEMFAGFVENQYGEYKPSMKERS